MHHQILPHIAEVDDLHGCIRHDKIIIVDLGSEQEYTKAHIPHSIHLDSDSLRLNQPPAPGLVPDDNTLLAVLKSIGLGKDSHIVAYDHDFGAKAARLLWTLALVGHCQHTLLNGGFAAWKERGYAIEESANNAAIVANKEQFQSNFNADVIADKAYVLAALDDPNIQILDARSANEFNGLKSVSTRKGHIPGAINLDWMDTIDRHNNSRLKPADEIIGLLNQHGFDKNKEIIVHCQTHMRSSHSFVMLKSLGFKNVRGYAGSWSEWSDDPNSPITKNSESA